MENEDVNISKEEVSNKVAKVLNPHKPTTAFIGASWIMECYSSTK